MNLTIVWLVAVANLISTLFAEHPQLRTRSAIVNNGAMMRTQSDPLPDGDMCKACDDAYAGAIDYCYYVLNSAAPRRVACS
jgi:hypothetical protein